MSEEHEVIRARFFDLEGMVKHCEELVGSEGDAALVVYRILRTAGRSGRVRLFGRWGGPTGRVVSDAKGEVVAMFAAREVAEGGRRMLGRMILEWPGLLERGC